jgi:alpha-L-fucosidase
LVVRLFAVSTFVVWFHSNRKWEATRGIDPHSFGFNSATLPDQYANASSLIQLLVDAVSKGGNLLLDMGPDKDGVVSDPQQNTLKGMGSWLGVNGEAIYNTTYWWVTSQENNLRFTYASKAFYITALENPASGNVTIKSPIPIAQGNTIQHLGSSCGPFQWSSTDSAAVTFAVPDNCLHTVANVDAWVFKVNWA